MRANTIINAVSHAIIIALLVLILLALRGIQIDTAYLHLMQDPALQEAHAKAQVIQYGKDHPEDQRKIIQMLASDPQMTYMETLQVLGISVK